MPNPTPRDILFAADPTAPLEELQPSQMLNEALEVGLFAVQEQQRRWGSELWLDALLAGRPEQSRSAFGPQQIAHAEGLLQVVADNGPWIKPAALYDPLASRPELACQHCLFFKQPDGVGQCAIVLGEIAPDATCRFITVPSSAHQPSPRSDGHEPPKRIVAWHGLKLGLSHYPGDQRHGRPMTAYYGHVRGTYGQAEDGMAVDVYLAAPSDAPADLDPAALQDLLAPTVFRVMQIVPETGELDECKYILGAPNIEMAEGVYLAHMPEQFFGGIEPASLDDIKPCRQDAELRLDARHLVRYQGLSIGITHQPGDRRFSQFGKPMAASYGYISGSYGDALDGKALDVYLAPDFDPTISRPIWRVAQRNPDSGSVDEYKYMIGYPSLEAARESYVFHAGRDRFGLIERATTTELDPYRQGVRTAASPRRRRSQSRKTPPGAADDDTPGQARLTRDGWIGVHQIRQDATDPDVLGEQMTEALAQALTPTTEQWLEVSQRWLKQQGSLEIALRTLEQSPEQLLGQMELEAMGDRIFETMLLADFAGREEVIDEADPDEIRLDSQLWGQAKGARADSAQPLARTDDAAPPWLTQEFDEAVGYFLNKVNVPVESYAGMAANYHDWAFSVAHMTQADWLDDAKTLLNESITGDGKSFDDFQKEWKEQISSKGWEPGVQGGQRLWTIFNTNVRGAMGAGRYAQMTNPAVLAQRNLWLWRWRDSPNPRRHHQALHMKAIPADDPFWRRLRMPPAWGCRCTTFAITEDYAQRNGIEILTNPPDPDTISDPEFRTPYNAEAPYDGRDRNEFLTEKLQAYSPKLREVLLKRLNELPPPPPMPPPPDAGPDPIMPEPDPVIAPTPSLTPPPPPPPDRYSPEGLMQEGRKQYGGELKRLDDAIAAVGRQAEFGSFGQRIQDIWEASGRQRSFSEIAEQVSAERDAERAQLLEPLEAIRNNLLNRMGETEAKAMVDGVRLESFKRADAAKVRQWMTEVTRITGGKALDTLNTVLRNQRDNRAYANPAKQLISLGKNFSASDYNRSTLFHEMGHHIEFGNRDYAQAASAWIRSKATSPTPERLSTLTGIAEYGPEEVALPGDFIDPYVGKIYSDGYTEVVSMGLEAFSSLDAMLALYRADPDHFVFLLGVLND